MYINVGIYNTEKRRINVNVVYFDVDLNNVEETLSFLTLIPEMLSNVEITLWTWSFVKN